MAIHLAQLDAFVANLRDGLQTKLIENGKEISGGERRRIGIARAILQNPQIIFADEMTAHLDMEQAKQIEEVLVSLNTTIISIAHRSYLYSKEFYDGTLAITKGHITFTKKRKVLSANTESQVIL